MSGLPENRDSAEGLPRKVCVMLKLSAEEAAGLDRLAERMGDSRRAPTLKRLLAACVKRSDEEAE